MSDAWRRGVRAALAVVAAGLLAPLAPVATPAAAAPAVPAGAVRVQVTDISNPTPAFTSRPLPLTISVTLTNTTNVSLPKVSIRAARGEPIGSQRALDESLAQTRAASSGLAIPPTHPRTVALAAEAQVKTSFVTTTSLVNDGRHLCLCGTQVYPLVLSAYAAEGGTDELLGATTTYLPSIYKKVAQPLRVSWVWPLVDRPHRLLEDTVFTDDALAQSVAGGALDRSLQVLEGLPPTIPLTLVVDPELLDELEVMATGKYTVQAPGGQLTSPGTGKDAAANWLARFTGLLTSRPTLAVKLAPFGDPDLRTLSAAGLSWNPVPPAPMNLRVMQALGGHPVQTGFAWPPSGTLDKSGLDDVAKAGADTVLLDSASVSPSAVGGIPASVARVASSGARVTAALTSSVIESRIGRSFAAYGGTGFAELPVLVSELAVRAIQNPAVSSTAVLTPPRYVDPDVPTAIRTIEETSTSAFSVPASLASVVAEPPSSVSRLASKPPAQPALPAGITRTVGKLADERPVLRALLAAGPAAQALLTELPQALQRLSSAAWRPGVGPFGPGIGVPLAEALDERISAILSGVRIVKPSSGSYTLASSNARLPITVENQLDYAVHVDVNVTTQQGVPGYTSRGVQTKTVAPHQKVIVQIPSRVERSGRIPVQAQLSAPGGAFLGPPVRLYVHSTVFGTIGVVITVVAGAVLVLALLLRVGRRMSTRRKKRVRPRRDGVPVPAGGAAP